MKKIIYIGILLIFILSGIYSLNELSKSRSFQLFGNLISEVKTNDKVVALTFDDGPGINTEKVLNILDEENIKATFFLTGNEIKKNKAFAKKIVEFGHEIGNHTYSHHRMVFKSYSFIKEEIEKTDSLIREIGYNGTIYFRPPGCKKLILLPYYLRKNNRYTILWNIEPESYPEISKDSKKIISHVMNNIKPGSIILLHVMYESREETVKALKPLVVSLKEKGYHFVTVSELLKY